MRLGGQSLQSEEGVVFSERQTRQYRAADGTTFSVIFAADAEIPDRWTSAKTSQEGVLRDAGAAKEVKPARTHWDMLLERRSREELEELLQERLTYLRSRRGKTDQKAS